MTTVSSFSYIRDSGLFFITQERRGMPSISQQTVGFRYGTQAQIDALSIFQSGIFYVATDTGNMYLGMDDGTKKILGGKSSPNVTFSTSEPTSTDGSDGDIWCVYEE